MHLLNCAGFLRSESIYKTKKYIFLNSFLNFVGYLKNFRWIFFLFFFYTTNYVYLKKRLRFKHLSYPGEEQ